MQTMAKKGKKEPWAAIDKIAFSCSPQRAKLDETLALTVGFQVNGGYVETSSEDSGKRPTTSTTQASDWGTG